MEYYISLSRKAINHVENYKQYKKNHFSDQQEYNIKLNYDNPDLYISILTNHQSYFQIYYNIYYIYLLYSINMIPNPICNISHAQSHKFCIYQYCHISAFICKHCHQNQCKKNHYHNQKNQFISWNQVASIIQKLQTQNTPQILQKIQKQVRQLIGFIQNKILSFLSQLKSNFQNFKISSKNKQIIQNLKNKNKQEITGMQMKQLYDQLIAYSINKKKPQIQTNLISKLRQFENFAIQTKDTFKTYTHLLQRQMQKYQTKRNVPKQLTGDQIFKFQKYSSQIQFNPNDTTAYFNRGLLYKKAKLYKQAELDYNKAIQKNPKNFYAYLNRGNLYLKENRFIQAEQDYSKALQCNSKYADAYFNRGLLYLNIKKVKEAFRDFSSTIQIDSKSSQAYFNRGNLYNREQKYRQAQLDYSKAIQINARKHFYYSKRSEVNRKLNRVKQAIEDEKMAAMLKN